MITLDEYIRYLGAFMLTGIAIVLPYILVQVFKTVRKVNKK